MTEDLSDSVKKNPFGGWLIVIQIVLFLLIFGRLNDVQVFYGLLGEEEKLLKTQGITDPHLYSTFIYTELISSTVLLLWAFILVYFFFKRLKVFPLLMMLFVVVDQLSDVVVYILFHSLAVTGPYILQKLIFGIIIALVIIFYLVTSKRVKLTFTGKF